MSKLQKIFLMLAIITALIGFSGMGTPVITGLGKALGASFLILFFILRLFENEPA